VEEHIHQRQAAGIRHDFVSSEGVKFQEFLLVAIERVILDKEIVGREKKSSDSSLPCRFCSSRHWAVSLPSNAHFNTAWR